MARAREIIKTRGKKSESYLEEIISYYGSLADYNEEQRRCGLATIETALQGNPFNKQIKIENARPLEVKEMTDTRSRLRHSWLRLFSQKV